MRRNTVQFKEIFYAGIKNRKFILLFSSKKISHVIIDEVQLRPELFSVLRVLLDRKPLPAKFLILGSASPDLLRQSSQSLAGRLEILEIGGFDLMEVGRKKAPTLWVRGGFPLSFLAKDDTDSFVWRKNFIRTFLERDLREYGIDIASVTLHRLWAMIANSHGQVWNAAPIASSLGISGPTVRKYLDIFTGVFITRQLWTPVLPRNTGQVATVTR